MTPDERLTEVFDRGLKHGEAALTPAEHSYSSSKRAGWVLHRLNGRA